MPKPIYTLCVQYSMENKENGLVSLIDIIEKLQLTPLPPPPTNIAQAQIRIVPWHPFRVMALWMLNPEDDPDAEYEFQIAFIQPSKEETIIGTGPAKFTKTRPFFRGAALIQSPPPISGAGLLYVVSKIRIKGKTEWTCQEYPIVVESVQVANTPANTQGV